VRKSLNDTSSNAIKVKETVGAAPKAQKATTFSVTRKKRRIEQTKQKC
jgi:hypothetical protein